MLTPDFAFCHSVAWEKWLGRGVNADEFAPATTLKCRVNLKQTLPAAGSTQTSAGSALFPAGTDLNPGDRLRFGGRTHIVRAVQRAYDLLGCENHVEAELT